MGGSNQKIKVAIIDENQREQDFQLLTRQDKVSTAYYDTYEKFLENQSLKKLSYIIIREKDVNEKDVVQAQNSTERKKKENIGELSARFLEQSRQKNVTVREKLLTYIKKYSLQKLVIYIYIRNALDYQVPQYDVPYITLISDSLQAIIDHVKTKPKREQPSIFKFKRLVKDLYRRSTVRILQQTKDDKQETLWKDLMSKDKISVDFSVGAQAFEQSLISNYSDYIIVNTPSMLTYIIDAKKQFEFDSKIIYFGDEADIADKKKFIWMVSKRDKQQIVKTIKRCSDLITDQTSARPKLTIIFTNHHYDKDQKTLVTQKTIELLKLNNKGKDLKWIEDMKLIITSNYAHLKDAIKKFVYTYLITFDCTISQTEDLKAWLKKQNYANRVYIYNLEAKDQKVPQTKQARMNQLTKKIQTMIKKAGFKIKFQIGPLQSVALFQLGQRQQKYFSTKLGLVPTILNQTVWKQKYCIENRQKLIDNYYVVCNVQNYFDKLRILLASELQEPNSYFKDIKVVIYDKEQAIKQRWSQIIKIDSIAFVHYSLTKIQQFLDTVFVPTLKLSIFVKKALPQYIESLKNLDQSKSRALNIRGIIVSKNQLLKEVFSQNIITNIEFELNFRHYSITNRNSEQNIQDLYTFIAKFANLWRVGYDIVSNEDNDEVISTLKKDIKECLYKCKAYSLLEVSDDQFDYFYLKKIEFCKTFLDLQIAAIYITTLPHGVNKILQQIFSRPKQSCMIPKIFSSFIVVLLSAFCSVQDEVMGNKNLVVYIDDENLSSKLNTLNIGDILFNTSFILSGKNESDISNKSNNCLFIQFDDIPMLSSTFIKNYLYIQRFSFYKESSEYLIAPYTRFQVQKKMLNQLGKFHIYLHAINDEQKGFAYNVFKANSIDDKEIFNTIKQEIPHMNDESGLSALTQQAKSLYKKAEIISLYEQKKQMLKSINDSLEYKNFLNAMNKQRFLSALYHLNQKSKKEKMTTQIEAQYFKNMLGVQKSLIYFKINQFDLSIKQLQKVQNYLSQQNNEWVMKKIVNFKENMDSLSTKRHKLFNRSPKTKKWKIFAQKQLADIYDNRKQFKAVVVMQQQDVYWNVDYLPVREQFYLSHSNEKEVQKWKKNDKKEVFLPYKIKQNYGEHVNSFTNQMLYEAKNLSQLIQQQGQIGHYLKYSFEPNDQKKYTQKVIHKKPVKKRQMKTKHQLSFNDTSIELKQQFIGRKAQSYSKHVHQQIQEESPFKQYQHETIKSNNQEIHTNEQQRPTSQSKLIEIKGNSLQSRFGITQKIGWQSFYIGDKFVLTKKGKHIKGKMTTKMP